MADSSDPDEVYRHMKLIDTAVRVAVMESESKLRNRRAMTMAAASSSGDKLGWMQRRHIQDVSDAPVTSSPTVSPSATPSDFSSATPSSSPSASPSAAPFAAPSSAPSVSSSAAPSVTPSSEPSVTPSLSPSVTPSTKPSVTPSIEPSAIPSFSPSVAPSNLPSVERSNYPSREHHPSAEPSHTPSAIPSKQNAPTTYITVSPTISSMVQLTASPFTASPFPASPSANPAAIPPTISQKSSATAASRDNSSNPALGIIGFVLAFTVLLVAYRMSKRKRKHDAVIVELTSQLEPNMMPMIRRSDSGGWKGTYSEEQMQSIIDLNINPLRDTNDVPEHGTPNFPLASTEQQLEYIECGVTLFNEPAGESSSSYFDTDEDLMKAYDEAMAVDIEPENPDVEKAMFETGSIAMSGIGSTNDSGERDLPPIA
ncbi:hypothetical protein ACHAXA_005934 [Cyclostephanos tholiformis]|uniref:Circumsporozoite protein n=1 Tax=Cyclostephanos tholiformis TaxID=382380 RepID=A0ABD3RE59_9STRA